MENNNGGVLKEYSLPLILISATSLAAVTVGILLAVMLSLYMPLLISGAAMCLCLFFAFQNKKISIDLCGVSVKYFLGALKEQKYLPRDCGIFIKDEKHGTYIDIRTLKEKPEGAKKYIYLSEDILTDEQKAGTRFELGERIVILNYTDESYALISKIYGFNCESVTKVKD